MSMPQWMAKYPCLACGAGYGECSQFLTSGCKCCKDCSHPGHKAALPDPWTVAELEEMWAAAGREMDDYTERYIAKRRIAESKETTERAKLGEAWHEGVDAALGHPTQLENPYMLPGEDGPR